MAVGAVVVATCPVHLPGGLAAISIIAVTVVVINGVNLIDGLDLLAAGVTAVAAVGFAVILHGRHDRWPSPSPPPWPASSSTTGRRRGCIWVTAVPICSAPR